VQPSRPLQHLPAPTQNLNKTITMHFVPFSSKFFSSQLVASAASGGHCLPYRPHGPSGMEQMPSSETSDAGSLPSLPLPASLDPHRQLLGMLFFVSQPLFTSLSA